MAKARPFPPLEEMEALLGFKVDALTYPDENIERYYSDLRPIGRSKYERVREEYEQYENKKYRKNVETKFETDLAKSDTITHDENTVILTRRNNVTLFNFAVDIHLGFRFHLPLLCTSDEASRALRTKKLRSNACDGSVPGFLNFPDEVRKQIYAFAIPTGIWQTGDIENPGAFDFARCIGDPTGFYFPLNGELSVLRVNRQMRQEALPLAYRKTTFHLDDIDDLIRLLVAVGKIGRDNIESLELVWESKAEDELKNDQAADADDLSFMLPALHAARCVQLLKQCKRLAFFAFVY